MEFLKTKIMCRNKDKPTSACAVAHNRQRCFELAKNFSHLDTANLMKLIAERQRFAREFHRRLHPDPNDSKVNPVIEPLEMNTETMQTQIDMLNYYNQQIGMILGVPVKAIED